MTKRKIIKKDEEKCIGCGLYIPNFPEDAITTEEREAEPYNEKRTMENIVKAGKNTIIAHLKHLKNHKETGYLKEGILDAKTKELVAIGTAITTRCKYCIAIHVEKALKAGATKKEWI